MEVLNAKAAFLSNVEVLNLLRELQSDDRGQKRLQKNQNLATISYETVKYLENTPCKNQTPSDVQKFIDAVAPYKLTRAEKLQLLNQRPMTAVEIQLMIEESEERLTEQEIESLLEVVSETLPESESRKD